MEKYPKYEFILKSLGLQGLKVAAYKFAILTNPGLQERNDFDYPQQNEIEIQKVADSYLGTPVFDNITLDIDGEELRIDAAIIDVSQTKNIIKTSIQGLNGTVKEYIADGDYIISLKGVIVSETTEYPETDVATLIEILKRTESIRVNSKFLQLFGIDDIIIENYKLNQDEFQNTQTFEILALSDKQIELILNSNL
jgi:hypothetical protein